MGDTEEMRQLSAAVKHLERLSKAEYDASLVEVLKDRSRVREDRLWRVGRLIGITVKEPFATPVSIDPRMSTTGARRGWNLDPDSFANPSRESWQYQVLAGLLIDRDLRRDTWLGPSPDWASEMIILSAADSGSLPDDLAARLESMLHIEPMAAEGAAQHIIQHGRTAVPTSDEMTNLLWSEVMLQLQSPWHVAVGLQEMNSERGLWKCMGKSAAKYLCGDKKLQAALDHSARAADLPAGALSPQSIIGAGSVAAADALSNALPWLDSGGHVVAVGFLIIIGNIGLNGYCDWVHEYVSAKQEGADIES